MEGKQIDPCSCSSCFGGWKQTSRTEKRNSVGECWMHIWKEHLTSLLWLRSGITQFGVPTETLQNSWSLLTPSFPSPSFQQTGEENWRDKRQRSQVEITTIYCKWQWDKKMKDSNNSVNNREFKNAHHAEPNNTQPLTSQYPDPEGTSSPIPGKWH